jgi:hypothetical protein
LFLLRQDFLGQKMQSTAVFGKRLPIFLFNRTLTDEKATSRDRAGPEHYLECHGRGQSA